MKTINLNILKTLSILGLVLFFGCRREFEAPVVDNEILAPILHTNLSIEEIIPDSIREVNNDNFVTLVYRNELYNASLGSFKKLETREFNETAKLQTLTLSSKTARREISLGQIASEAGGPGEYIISQHDSMAIIFPISNLSYGPLTVDGTSFFETVVLDSGFMDIEITNGFPTNMANIEFEIRNESSNALVGTQTFSTVAAGETKKKTIDLAGKTVEGNLIGNILNFDVVGTFPNEVLIDTSDKITVVLTVYSMKVNSATAIFPAQNVIDLKDTNALKGEGVADILLTKATAKTGFVEMRVVSTIEDTMYFDYLIPGSLKDGKKFTLNEKINPAPPGGSITKTLEIPVDGYTFDLTGAPLLNTTNAFYSELIGRIDSTGKVVSLSLDDSLLVYVKLSNFVPEYIEGYLGNNEASIGPESVPLGLFKSFSNGSLEFEEVKMKVGVSNGNNVPFEVDLQELAVQNTKTNVGKNIDLSELENPLKIEGATGINTPWEKTWTLGNTNFNEALNIFPNRFIVGLNVSSNPDQNTSDLNQFAVDSNKLSAFADIEIPLSFIAKDLVLRDTTAFKSSSFQVPKGVQSGTLYLIVENSFDLEAKLSLTFQRTNGIALLAIPFENKAVASGSRGNPNQTVLEWKFDAEDLSLMLASKEVVFTAELNSESVVNPTQIYTDQRLEINMTTRFDYRFE